MALLCEAALEECGALLPAAHAGMAELTGRAREAAALLTPLEMRVVGMGWKG